MYRSLIILILCVSYAPLSAQQYLPLHSSAIVADGHNDILWRVMSGGEMESRATTGHSDLPRFREGGMDIQLFSIWVPSEKTGDDAWQFALDEIDSLKAIAARNPAALQLATKPGDMDRILSGGKLAGVIALEGGRCIDGRRDRILELYRRGLRSFGLTWNHSSDWASCSKDESTGKVKGGLSEKGKSFVRLLDSLGVLIDLSHLGERAFWDVAANSSHPLFASHSASKALRDHHRNLTDAQLRAVAKSGGVVMTNFFPGFIVSNMNEKRVKRLREFEKKAAALKKKHPKRGKDYMKEYDRMVAAAKKEGICTIDDVVAHIDHAVRIAGAEHVGLGSDFDGINLTPVGLNDVTDLPMLTRSLMKKGYSADQIRGILGGNFLRVWRAVVENG
ncbi:MAG: dipeptidase [Bacteroidetes bacterium]|nr:dipeptidase [Bacteroidota bacterium]